MSFRVGAELPAAVAADRDRHRLVQLGVQRLEHRSGRRERDLVLARAAAGDDGDADAARHGGGGVVVVVPVKWPTVNVTVVPGFACVPEVGSCVITMPSLDGSWVFCWTTRTLKPAASSVVVALPASLPSTFGTALVFGPLETVSVIFDPGDTKAFATGSCLITTSTGWSDCTSTRATEKPCPCRIEAADS